MATLPATTTISPTVLAIYAAYEAANEQWDSLGISVGEIGNPCDRALYYNLRWASAPEDIEGRKVSIFRTGDMWEERMVADLEAIGVEVWGQQERIRLASGHVRGKIDGRALGIVEAPKTEHLMEFKSSNTKAFAKIKKDGCRKAKPLHFAQCQVGMHALGLSRAGYMVTNKDDDERYFERVEYDADYCLRALARAERIIFNDEPPARLHEDPNHKMAFECGWCRHRGVCHEGAMPRVTCRSCLFASPERHGDGAWSCARWQKPLGLDEQREGCPTHLFVPGMVAGEQVDFDEAEDTVTYRLADGSIWIDGASA
ncbi:oxidoreductase [Bosea sp. NPDC055332]